MDRIDIGHGCFAVLKSGVLFLADGDQVVAVEEGEVFDEAGEGWSQKL